MAHPLRRRLVAVWCLAISTGVLASCGSRTGLFGDIDEDAFGDGGTDGSIRRDGGFIPGDGSSRPDALTDAIPPLDVVPRPDVDRRDCPDADATYVYIVTSQNELFSFYPPDLSFTFIGNLVCPAAPGETPFSMAVDRRGVAYVLYTDGSLFRVSTATAACTGTTYVPSHQPGFSTFGMGFASETNGAAERLFVSDNDFDNNLRGLGAIDTTTFALSFIGPIDPLLVRSELTGTGDGRLYAFSPRSGGSRLVELNKATGAIVGQTSVPIGDSNDAFAFAFWGGDFWLFTGRGPSAVTRFRPSDNTTVEMTTHPSTIVGAGVSTCAPQL